MTDWDTSVSPYRITSLIIADWEQQNITDLSAVNKLTTLDQLSVHSSILLKELNLSNLHSLKALDIQQTGLSWHSVTFPSVETYMTMRGNYFTDIKGEMGPIYIKDRVTTTVDLSQYVTEYGEDCKFEWYNKLDDKNPIPIEEVSGKKGVFLLTGGAGTTFFCRITHPKYGYWYLQTPDMICTASGGPEAKFTKFPNTKTYCHVNGRVDQPDEVGKLAVINIFGASKNDFRVYVQLKDKGNKNGTRIKVGEKFMSLTNGGFWVPEENVSSRNAYQHGFGMLFYSPNPAEVTYMVSLYRSEDLSTEPMDSGERTIVFIADEEYPRFGKLPDLHGELNTAIPLTFSIDPRYMKGKAAKLRVDFDTLSLKNMEVSGDGWMPSPKHKGTYEYTTDNLQQTQFTLYVTASNPVDGGYSVTLCDDKGIGVAYSIDSAAAPTIKIPSALGEPNATFIRLPNAKDYTSFGGVDQPGEGLKYAKINIYATSKSDFRVRVQLKDKTNKNGTWFTINDKVMPLTDGGFWVPEELVSCYVANKYAFGMVVHSPNPVEETYTVSLYRSEDLSTEPMDSGERTIVFIADEEYPRFGKLPDLHGELNTTIPLTFSIDPRYMKGKAARLVLSLDTLLANNMTIKGEGWKPSEKYKGNYVYDTDNLQQSHFTLYVTASNPVDGGYSVILCDDKGVGVAYSVDSAAAPTIKIPSASGEPKVWFRSVPYPINYQTVYKDKESSIYSSYTVEGNLSSTFKVRVQLKDQAQANDVRFVTNNKDLTLTDGGFWFPAEEIRKVDEYFSFDFGIVSSKAVEVDYTISLYQSEDQITKPMDSTEKTVVFVAEEDYPVLPLLPNLRGELNTDVPYTFSIEPGFLQGKPAIVRFYFYNVDKNNLNVSIKGWKPTVDQVGYEYHIDHLTQDKITVNFKATGQIGCEYGMALYDGEGNIVSRPYSAVLQFPANLSDDDQQALKAMQKANPESKELRDFIETGRYTKDIDVRETTERVAVTWNYETPSRVSDFLLRDDDRKVSTLNLNALKGLTTVRLQGTNLKTLDLSDLTLFILTFNNTPLKWSDVKLPKWTEYGHLLDGITTIQLNNPTVKKGEEIDLSEFAQVDTVASTFTWFEYKKSEADKRVELTQTSPGKFILDGEMGQRLYCEIKNERYGNWVLRTTVVTVGDPVIHFSQQDVKVLEKLVKDANDPKLNEWWESKAWQGFEMINGAQTEWSNENPRRLTSLWILQAALSETVDLSTLDRLEILSLMGYNNSKLTKLILPTEKASLRLLNVAGNEKLTSLGVTSYANLQHLDVSGTGLEACDVSKNTKLEVLYMQKTKIPGLEATAPEIAKQLVAYGVPNDNVTIDLDLFPALKKLIPNKRMRYSDVKHPRQMEPLDFDLVKLISLLGDAYDPNYSSYGHTIDVSDSIKQEGVTAGPIWAVYNPFTYETDTLSHTGMTYTIGNGLKPDEAIYAEVHNDLFPGWTLRYITIVYTMDGDVNLDRTVDVKDVTSLISSMLGKWPSDRNFGWIQANTNHDEKQGDAADLVGLVNIILGKPVTKGEALRAAYIPQAELSVDERNNLYIDHEAPISAIYLEFAGATKELALTGDAARMTQSRSLQNDTLRIVAYSMDGKSIATGKQALMQLAPGMQLTKASFSDAKAVPLKLVGDYLPTANETIAPFDEVKAVYNYPNPASGTTTFCYSLSEDANSVEIELIASNGAVVARLQGLPTAQGRHEENVSLPFGNGVYFYRLVLNGKQIVATNTLIIK